jgi:plastocyanin
MRKWILVLFILVTATIAAGCSGTQQPAEPQATETPQPSPVTTMPRTATPLPTPISQTSVSDNTVMVRDFAFTPQTITVKTGSIVRWENKDAVPHRIVFTDASGRDLPSGDNSLLTASQSYSRKFDTAGTYPYYCKIHPEMKGTVMVE